MVAKNLLIIMSDEHCRDVLGCYGHQLVKTPHLDALATRGVRFGNVYTPSPICVPTRASIATGRYIHEIGNWDSASPYDGTVASWGHRARDGGARAVSIGKLHFRSSDDDNGFDEEILPMHVVGGIGWPQGLVRQPMPDYRDHAAELAGDVGRGESSYTTYDRQICARACSWLNEAGRCADDSAPWTLFVSFVAPHYPLKAPEEFYDLYRLEDIDAPRHREGHMNHPVIAAMRQFWCYDDFFDDAKLRQGRLAYYGLVSLLDHHVGRLLAALEQTGLADDTTVIYTSDHGELLGNHGFWTKSLMYEESAAVPLIMAGPGVAKGEVCGAPASLIDLYPTVLEAMGVETTNDDPQHGRPLTGTVVAPDADRTILSEYHDGGSPTGFMMVRWADWKYVHYVGAPPQLFDLANDPTELDDLGLSTGHEGVRREGEERLRALLDPDVVNARALADQQAKIAALGGIEKLDALFSFNHTPTPREA